MIMTQVLISNNSLCIGQHAISQQEVLIGVLANNRVDRGGLMAESFNLQLMTKR